ncbi:hypothetical protein [Neptunomonas phycophila]|mgnify:FL=1|jgi:hypothetical protein|uniref:Uncharacterized protein n=1 Tax=Neptunomonas phycophila TaxID=1572645 RepID=A0AAW7XE64_9GAMM|nr:hypothetical protein [Neptunomonas phycophila]MDO6452548.1 hypothetical protein [Neptunomonas phycophila]QLE98202.1 hypothetical protein FLM49_11445 [Neptunomonas phycophila]
MKSYLFTTENDRGGVMLCDIDTLEDAVVYLQDRFAGVIRVEQGKDFWSQEEGYHFVEPPTPSVDSPPS